MSTIKIETLDDCRVAPYARLTEAQLRSRLNPADAMFVAESPKVIEGGALGGPPSAVDALRGAPYQWRRYRHYRRQSRYACVYR